MPAPRFGRLALAEGAQSARVAPVHPDIFRLAGVGDLERLAGEESCPQRARVDIIDARPGAEMHMGGSAVKTRDAVRPQPVVNVGVVAGPDEGLGVAPGEAG